MVNSLFYSIYNQPIKQPVISSQPINLDSNTPYQISFNLTTSIERIRFFMSRAHDILNFYTASDHLNAIDEIKKTSKRWAIISFILAGISIILGGLGFYNSR